MSDANLTTSLFKRYMTATRHRFSLIEDKADDEQIDTSIRAGVELRGTNLWVLIFAIFVASIGLNVNSTAVIIGAMLISPLMGPIMGVGYGAGIYDTQLIRKSFRNLGIATLISLLVSTLYFLLTPLSDAQSELLARTTPTIWDVLIALFGGLAGIIGATRAEKTNIIPGVAIATALMPPLCTAGYGLANGNWNFFFGAFYLYSINCVFIAFAAVLIIWVLNPTRKSFVNQNTEIRVRRALSAIVLLTMLPSVYLAVKLVKQEVFSSKAREFISKELTFKDAHLTERNIDATKKQIEVTLIGDLISKKELNGVEARMESYGLSGASLIVHQSKDNTVDITALKSNIVSELYKDNLYSLEEKNKTIQNLQSELQKTSANRAEWKNMAAELHAQYPQIREVLFSDAVQWKAGSSDLKDNLIVLNATASSKISNSERYRITEWLKVRTKSENVKLIID
ncbi:TIGR00341 family protein [Methylotenera sp.]|uniref:TIGR00341 family protein n=1 Tax=Methylotenera sp. TaxID=2051956 RepID=UPI00248A60C7|nr:TIGR00341 family protein [Methylotenera sp.]MDI1299540.1 TIGR00341 family protein [Methylotenera sp.]